MTSVIRPRYDLRLLGVPKNARAFDAAITATVAQSPRLHALAKIVALHQVPLSQCYDDLTRIVKQVAEKQLAPDEANKKRTKKPMQERRDLLKLVHANHRIRRIDSMRQYNRLSDYPAPRRHLVLDLVQATRAYERARKEADKTEAEEALRKMSKTSHINVRLDLCFKFLKARKRSSLVACPNITHQSLDLELSKLDHGPIATVPLNDHIPMSPPPSVREYENALLAAKTGISPGLDLIHPVFYHASSHLLYLTAKLMHASYIQSCPPSSWSQTTITLIPKIPNPKSYADYRPITLSPVS